MRTSASIVHTLLSEALTKGPPPPGNLAVPVFSRDSLEVELYTPKGHDPQKPHSRDELYFVACGNGLFIDGTRQYPVTAGSFLFVPAGQPHHFEAFLGRLCGLGRLLWGPEGGELISTRAS
jgi:hypothetical protein